MEHKDCEKCEIIGIYMLFSLGWISVICASPEYLGGKGLTWIHSFNVPNIYLFMFWFISLSCKYVIIIENVILQRRKPVFFIGASFPTFSSTNRSRTTKTARAKKWGARLPFDWDAGITSQVSSCHCLQGSVAFRRNVLLFISKNIC